MAHSRAELRAAPPWSPRKDTPFASGRPPGGQSAAASRLTPALPRPHNRTDGATEPRLSSQPPNLMKPGPVFVLISALWACHPHGLNGQETVQEPHAPAAAAIPESAADPWSRSLAAAALESPARGETRIDRAPARYEAPAADRFQSTAPPIPLVGAFIGLGIGAGVATYKMSGSNDGPDAGVLIYLPIGAATGWLAGRLFQEIRGGRAAVENSGS